MRYTVKRLIWILSVIQLAIIRILETYFRNPILYIIPSVLLVFYGVLDTFVLSAAVPEQFITGMTIHVRPNELIQNISTASDRSQSSFVTSSELMANEIWNLLDTKPFMDELIARSDFTKEEHTTQYGTDYEKIEESILDSLQTIELTDNQIVLVITYENHDLTTALMSNLFNLYIERKIENALKDTGNAAGAINTLVENYAVQRRVIEEELSSYLGSHPEPEDISLNRRDIETLQIERLEEALARADNLFDNAVSQREETSLATSTIESSIHQTYIVIDGPLSPIPITSIIDKLISIIIFGGLGAVISTGSLIVVAFFNQRIMVPLDAKTTTQLPILGMVEYDSSEEEHTRLQQLFPVLIKRKRQKEKRQTRQTLEPES